MDAIERASIERKVGEALFRLGEHERAQEHVENALRLLGRPYPNAPSGIKWATTRRRFASSVTSLPAPVWRRRPRRELASSEELCLIYRTMSYVDYMGDPERFVLSSLLYLNHAQNSSLEAKAGNAHSYLAAVASGVPSPRLARYYGDRALRLAEAKGNPVHIGDAYLGEGMYHELLGQADAAVEDFSKAAQYHRLAGSVRGVAGGDCFAFELLLAMGKLDKCWSLPRRCCAWGRRQETPRPKLGGGRTWVRF